MKTPFDNFILITESAEITDLFRTYIQWLITLKHKYLPLELIQKVEYTDKLSRSNPNYEKDVVNKCISNIYRETYLLSEHGKTAMPIQDATNKYHYFGQWDKERGEWFITDKNGNLVYESDTKT